MNLGLRHLCGAALCGTFLLTSGHAPASALPGQTLAQFHAWAHGKIFFRENLESSKNEMSGLPQFHVRSADRGVAWDLRVTTNGSTVTEESFGLTDTPSDIGSEPIRHDGSGYGFTFFRSVYGSAVAADFRNAKLVTTIADPVAKARSAYYRGKLYGYVTSGGYVALQTPAYFATSLAEARRCAKHPESCSE